jgi:hypothetical protein
VAADALVEPDPVAAAMAAPGGVAVEQADGDEERDYQHDCGAEGLDVEDYPEQAGDPGSYE